MKRRFRIVFGVTVVTIVLCGHAPGQEAGRSGRSQAAARQQVGHALARARAGGQLTPKQRDAILAMAGKQLTRSEFEHLSRWLVGTRRPPNREQTALTMPSPFHQASRPSLVSRIGPQAPLPDVTPVVFVHRLAPREPPAEEESASGFSEVVCPGRP